jgi:ankyrin repeat protein
VPRAPSPGRGEKSRRLAYTDSLHDAARSGNLDRTKALLDRGADVNKKSGYGQTALHRAASHGHEQVVALLLERGADVNLKDDAGRTALYLAAE